MLSINNIYIQYGDRILLNNITLTIKEKEKIGLVGRNGAGKSTILKVISQYISPDKGSVSRPNESTLCYLHQELDLPKGKTVIDEALTAFEEVKKLEQAILDMEKEMGERTDYESDSYMQLLQDFSDANERFNFLGGQTMQADAERILTGLGFKNKDMNRLTDEFSGGWQMRIELAKMLLQRPDYLLLDEPTNHLDIESIIWLEDFLKTYEGVVIIISHDKMFLDHVTNKTVEIELGNVYEYKAPYSKYVELRKERKEKTEAAYKNQQRVIAHKEKIINKFMAKATKTKMAQSMKKQLDKLERVEIAEEDVSTMNIQFPPAPRSGRVVIDAQKIVKNYGDLKVLSGVDFTMERGDRVSFVGQNGQGKTTLSKILINVEPSTSGDVELGHNVQVGYYAQNQAETLNGDKTLLQVMESKAPEEMRTKIRSILGAFMFSGEDAEKKVKVLSGGERARLALACMLLQPFNLLVLDEPTNHLDMLSKEVLKEAIKQYDGTLVVVSHDRDFLQGLTNKTIEFRDQKLYEYLGDIDYFLEKRKIQNMREAEKRSVQKKEKITIEETIELSAEQQQLLHKKTKSIKNKISNVERKINDKEKEIKTIESKMAATDFYESPKSQEVIEKYQNAKIQLDELMEEWELYQMDLDELNG